MVTDTRVWFLFWEYIRCGLREKLLVGWQFYWFDETQNQIYFGLVHILVGASKCHHLAGPQPKVFLTTNYALCSMMIPLRALNSHNFCFKSVQVSKVCVHQAMSINAIIKLAIKTFCTSSASAAKRHELTGRWRNQLMTTTVSHVEDHDHFRQQYCNG